MIYLTAGHNNADPGASGNSYTEATLTKELRDLVLLQLANMSRKAWHDDDNDTLSTVLHKMTPTEKDVCLDIHFNAGPPAASGVEVIIADRHTREEMSAAVRMSMSIANIMGIKTRGAKTEADTARKMIGIVRNELGINLLIEVCFISNKTDMQRYQAAKTAIAVEIALQLCALDDLMV